MISFGFLKKAPVAFVLRIFALVFIFSMIGINIFLLQKQIERLKQGSIRDIKYFQGSESDNYAVIIYATPYANEWGVFMGDIVLNPEIDAEGEIGTSVTYLIKSGGAPAREVTFIRRSSNYSGYFIVLRGLSPHAKVNVGIFLLYTSLIFTGFFSLMAFGFHLDAWLAFFVVVAFSHVFVLFSANPVYAYFSLLLPSAIILFFVLFPNGKLDPNWSWLLVLWPLFNNILSAFATPGMFWSQSMNLPYHIFVRYGSSFFLLILWGYVRWHRNFVTPAERQRLNWLFFVMFICVFPDWFHVFLALRVPLDSADYFRSGTSLWWNQVLGSGYIVYRPVWILLMGVVVYRYLCSFIPVERQQMKWLIFGLISIVTPLFISYIFFLYYHISLETYYRLANQTNLFLFYQNGQSLILKIIDAVVGFGVIIVFLSVLLAMLRFRLYDIDIYINCALVSCGLIIMAGVVYLLTTIFIDQTLGRIPGNQKAFLAIPISVFFVIVTFKPVCLSLQKLVNKYFTLEEFSFAKAFFEFTPEVHGLLTLPELSKLLVTRSYEQFGVAYASAFIKNKNGKLQHIKTVLMSGKTPKLVIEPQEFSKLKKGELVLDIDLANSIIVPLALSHGQNSDCIGALVLGPRLNGLGYSTEMKKSLKNLGEEVGKALYVAQVKERRVELHSS